jgi:hypothetical protein
MLHQRHHISLPFLDPLFFLLLRTRSLEHCAGESHFPPPSYF